VHQLLEVQHLLLGALQQLLLVALALQSEKGTTGGSEEEGEGGKGKRREL
jgi:hypothetical protein